jgi:periplasmic copper chaperone A
MDLKAMIMPSNAACPPVSTATTSAAATATARNRGRSGRSAATATATDRGRSGRSAATAAATDQARSGRYPSRRNAAARAGAVGLALALGAALTGCAAQAATAAPPIQVVTAYVGAPSGASPTDAYVSIRNNGGADRLISAHTSVGGTVTLRGPVGDQPSTMRDYRAVPIPAHSFVRLIPNGYHLVISGARAMKAGTDITLTLMFARAGAVHVLAQVTNPQTGGSSYFLN